MKSVVILLDGAADTPVLELGGKTPLEVAEMETINELASKGKIGTVKTVPDGIAPKEFAVCIGRSPVCDI